MRIEFEFLLAIVGLLVFVTNSVLAVATNIDYLVAVYGFITCGFTMLAIITAYKMLEDKQ